MLTTLVNALVDAIIVILAACAEWVYITIVTAPLGYSFLILSFMWCLITNDWTHLWSFLCFYFGMILCYKWYAV